MRMTRLKGLIAAAGLAALLAVGVACSNNGEAAPTDDGNQQTSTGQPSAGAPAVDQPAPIGQTGIGVAEPSIAPGAPVQTAPAPAIGAPAPSVDAASSVSGGYGFAVPSSGISGYYGYPQYSIGGDQTGIWVTGQAILNVQPDLAILNIGVETTGATVEEARTQAATAMDAIINALHARGIEDRDIQTQFFNIYPRYEYREVFEGGVSRGKQELVGYTVNNSATVKIRDLDAIGEIIDEVATAGGDATRINGVSFTVEDPKALESTLREAAVNDAMAKAEQFAALTGVTLGKLVFIAEISGGSPVVQDFARAEAGFAAPAAPTPINVGETQLSMAVQAVFAIE
ncbi:MAG: SIMPL domain-containing protein [Chloroflexi bacterium]|nr:SIMPL domain-containing protein [Chloroflexota bacterium]